jgi:hypothetical protein
LSTLLTREDVTADTGVYRAPKWESHRGGLCQVKAALRKFEARTREALVEAMGRSLDTLTPRTLVLSSSIAATA